MADADRSRIQRLRARLGGLLRPDAQVRALASNSSWVFLANAFKTVFAFVRSIVIARGLGVELFGTYVLAAAGAAAVQEVLNPNLYAVVVKFGADYKSAGRPDKLVALVKGGAVAGLALAALSVLAVWGAVTLFSSPASELPGFVLLCAVAGIGGFVSPLGAGLLRLFFRFRVSALVAIGLGLADLLAVVLALALFPGSLPAFFAVVVAMALATAVVLSAAAAWELRADLGAHRRAPVALVAPDRGDIVHFVLHNSGSRTLKVLMDRGDVLLLGAIAGAGAVGLYEIAKKLAYTVLRFTDPLTDSIFPQVAELISARRFGEVRGLLLRTTAGLGALSAAVGAVGLGAGGWALVTLYGADFAPAAAPLAVHLATALISATLFWTLPVTLAFGHVRERLGVMAAALVLGGGLGLLLTPAWGAVGMAAASLVSKTFVLLALAALAWTALRRPAAAPIPSAS